MILSELFALTRILRLTLSQCNFFCQELELIDQLFNDNVNIKPWEDLEISS